MTDRVYNWKRFWCPREGSISLSDGGYLFDPDSEYGQFYNPDVVPFEAIADIPCLVLLGEPGIGKSTEMEAQFEIAKSQRKGPDEALWFNLRNYQTDDRLCKKIFENATFQSWREGKHRLHLFLDSLDEGLIEIKTLVFLLGDELSNYPVDRLYFRIACRTASWPSTLENKLRELWGKEAVGISELVPLRRVDVAEAARVEGLDPELFLQEVTRREAVPLAINPITLRFLLNIYHL